MNWDTVRGQVEKIAARAAMMAYYKMTKTWSTKPDLIVWTWTNSQVFFWN